MSRGADAVNGLAPSYKLGGSSLNNKTIGYAGGGGGGYYGRAYDEGGGGYGLMPYYGYGGKPYSNGNKGICIIQYYIK
jgi:hypothetical protein